MRGYNTLLNLLNKLFNKSADVSHLSYSQSGEDRIMQYLFNQLGVSKPRYIDIGAHHPTILSNTHLFYLNGSRGINIEADPQLIDAFYTARPSDININAGIGLANEEMVDFYLMSSRVLNTFSKADAESAASYGTYHIQSVVKIKVISLQNIIDKYFKPGEGPDMISLDVEGLDFQILQSIDLTKYKKTIFCVETLTYAEDATEKKQQHIADYFAANGFFVYADTYINTIFVNTNYWCGRFDNKAGK